ncbi:DUF4129 domain-containing protein [Agromyces aerolatus]|uniref:DUF4129 domain-containing protein n=1 Tax=Agromyces sp. LY-1074 TaxID=3074080 RepID=UPI0028579E2E|nr:DUF4129 domain-containing protein [Agromyces sp. LY-1074]MDR5699841.1 DUF4129 domain-containing protein [Agromyces sp. LY-1074]
MHAADVPVIPDAPEARRWLLDELSRPEYREAEPTAFDLAAQAVRDWLLALLSGSDGLPGPVLALIVVLVVVALVIVGLLVFGLPRRRRRRAALVPLFDDGDTRSLDELRRAARAAAADGRFDVAIEERFRAIVRALVDRELVSVHPGTTAHGFARAAAAAFPAGGGRLEAAAGTFDAVRYLGRPGSLDEVRELDALDDELDATSPAPAHESHATTEAAS